MSERIADERRQEFRRMVEEAFNEVGKPKRAGAVRAI
jgi:hypothetical protein